MSGTASVTYYIPACMKESKRPWEADASLAKDATFLLGDVLQSSFAFTAQGGSSRMLQGKRQ